MGGRVGRLVLAIGLMFGVGLAFGPILGNGFVAWDDDENIVDNPNFRGLGPDQVGWAWTTTLLGVYQPLAWMALEAQYAASGLDPLGYHATSLAMHAAVAIAVMILAATLIGRRAGDDRRGVWAGSALAAALFALHPLRTEAVAWASCQPYLPAVLLAILAALAHIRAVDAGGRPGTRRAWLAATFGLALAALLCKAVAVSVPALLLVLDAWPLNRLRREGRRAWVEKAPLFGIALLFTLVAVRAKADDDALASVADYGVGSRAAQACYGIGFYLIKTIVPLNLTAYYPLPARVDPLAPAFAASILAVVGLTIGAWSVRRRWPGVPAAWAAYLLILAPNLGLARVGNQIAADRYSYAASIPLAILAAEALRRAIRPGGRRAAIAVGLALATAAGWGVLAHRQALTWRTDEALWSHALSHGADRVALAHNLLGSALAAQGRPDEGLARYAEALRIDPGNADAHNLTGVVLAARGDLPAALARYDEAVRLEPDFPIAHSNRGAALAALGRLDEAAVAFAEAVRLEPDRLTARGNLARALARLGRHREAAGQFEALARLDPTSASAFSGLGVALARLGRLPEAEAALLRATRLAPRDPDPRNNLGMALAQSGRPDEAAIAFAEAVRLKPDFAAARSNLGLALAQQGRAAAAVDQFADAARLDPASADAQYLWGDALAQVGRPDEAAARYREALRLDPGHAEARRALDSAPAPP